MSPDVLPTGFSVFGRVLAAQATHAGDADRSSFCEPFQLMGQKGRIRPDDHDDRALRLPGDAGSVRRIRPRARRAKTGPGLTLDFAAARKTPTPRTRWLSVQLEAPTELRELLPDRHARNPEQPPAAVVALHEDTDGILAGSRADDPRGASDPTLEPVADHRCAAADVSLRDRSGGGAVQGRENVRSRDMEAGNIAERPRPGLADDREEPDGILELLHVPLVRRVPDDPHAVRAGDHHGPDQEAGLLDKGRAGQLTETVEREPAGEDGSVRRPAPRQNRRNARADRSLARPQLALPRDQGDLADLHAGNIRDRVEGTWEAVKRDSEVPGADFAGLLRSRRAIRTRLLTERLKRTALPEHQRQEDRHTLHPARTNDRGPGANSDHVRSSWNHVPARFPWIRTRGRSVA